MELKELQRLAESGESETVEFKKSTAQLPRAGETLCAFLNGQGGRVLIGVTSDGKIVVKQNHRSLPRNQLIAGVFYRRRLVEQWGRGTQMIVELCVRAGYPEPEFLAESAGVGVRFLPSVYIAPHRAAPSDESVVVSAVAGQGMVSDAGFQGVGAGAWGSRRLVSQDDGLD